MKKNILVIFTDQQRTDTMGFNNPLCKTPNIDKLYENGISFDRCITPSPLCGPARASMFTGKYAHQVKGICPPVGNMHIDDSISRSDTTMLTNDYTMDEKPILPNLLKENGYDISYAGKWHLGNDIIHNWFEQACGYSTADYSKWCKENGLVDGWAFNDKSVRSHRFPYMSTPKPAQMDINAENHGDAWITAQSISYIKNRDKTKPFFTVCALNGPHPPFKMPKEYLNYYNDIIEKIPCPENFATREGKPAYLNNCYYRLLSEDYSKNWSDWQKSVAAYWGLTKLIDDQVGKLLKTLEDEGVLEDTYIIYVSDHGEMMGSHGLWHKMEAYEEALRIPMIISCASIPHKVNSNASVSLLDFVPTVLDMANVNYDKTQFEGQSLFNMINGKPDETENRMLYSQHRPLGEFHKSKNWRMACDKYYKYIWAQDDIEQLYNMQTDRAETNNLCTCIDGNIIDKYRKALKNWAFETNDPLKEKIALSYNKNS